MANTYSQILIHIVFAVESRQYLIPENHKEELHKYITGIIQNKNHKLLAVHCMPDHTHILLGLHPDTSISALVRDIKNNSSRFINDKQWFKGTFRWQLGYGAFSYGRSQLDRVVKYIANQETRHKRQTFLRNTPRC